MFFIEKIEPRPDDYDEQGLLSYESMLKVTEPAATHHTRIAGDALRSGNVAWIITDWRLSASRRPAMGETLEVTTWIRNKPSAAVLCREFTVRGEAGGELFRAEARVALLDVQTNKLLRINGELYSAYQPEDAAAFESDLPRLREREELSGGTPVTVRRSDIDYNGHVHNTRYIDYALEVLGEDERGKYSNLRIVYKSQLKAGDNAIVKRGGSDGACLIGIYSDERLCTLIELS